MHREFSKIEKEFIGEFFLRLEILTSDEIEKILHWQKKMPNRLFGEIGFLLYKKKIENKIERLIPYADL